MNLEKNSVNARRHAGRRQRLYELGLPGGDAVTAARKLQAVRHVVDHRISQRAHDGEGAHVDDEVVIAEREPALGDDDLLVASARHLVDGVLDVIGRQELALLDVHDAVGARRGFEQVRLARQECRNLQDVGNLGDWRGVRGLVDVGQDGDAGALADSRQHTQAGHESRAAKRAS